MEDRQIIDLYLRREERAITATAEKYGTRLRSVAFGILRDEESSRECENDTYFSAWNHIPPQEPYAHFFGYLAKIARNLALNICRAENRLKRDAFVTELSSEMEECIPSQENVDFHMEERELQKAINDFLGKLNREKRVIFLRRYFYMDSVEEIAKRMGITVSKVKVTLFRCRNDLKAYLEREGYTV